VLRSKWGTLVVAGLVAMSVATASLSGPWGQGVKNSRLLLQQVKTYESIPFVGDDRTIEDLYVLNGLSLPDNVFSAPGARSEIRKLAPTMNVADPRGVIVMVNPMRDRVFDTTTTHWLADHQGPTVHTGPTVYRPIGYMLPESLRGRYNFLIRREPYTLCEFCDADGSLTRPEGVLPVLGSEEP
jgi:hypothetical protein